MKKSELPTWSYTISFILFYLSFCFLSQADKSEASVSSSVSLLPSLSQRFYLQTNFALSHAGIWKCKLETVIYQLEIFDNNLQNFQFSFNHFTWSKKRLFSCNGRMLLTMKILNRHLLVLGRVPLLAMAVLERSSSEATKQPIII